MIGVTGATGGVGSGVVRHLLAAPERPEVAALARRPEAVPASERLSARRADYDDAASLREAFEGLRTLVFVSSDGTAETMTRHHRNVVAAAAEAGVEHVVYSGILDAEADSRFYYSPGHRETERLLAASGIAHCLARTSIFADFFTETWLEAALKSGVLALPTGDGSMSLVSRGDVSRGLAAAALRGTEGVVDLTGPEALTAAEVCAVAEAATGRPVRHDDLDEDDHRERLAAESEPAWLIEAYSSMFRSVREGRFAAVSRDCADLTGERGQTFAEFLSGR
ncbi:NAD(P)H-binding protein [Glycomyces tenuis]|uniref:NAD(P)H-binding protein n=1 Tax=Glycomyces tenuis TaxID=58116 RepID=UPI0004025B23|nr:NAD(P)H-binding protein [Glycomyces tenuis]